MKDIELKLLELDELLKNVPIECKGPNNSANRMKYVKIKYTIAELLTYFPT